MMVQSSNEAPGLLGDTAERDYARKLRLFNACAEPELRQAIATLELKSGMRVLDAGCGTGEMLRWLAEIVGAENVTGIDLSIAHINAARACAPPGALVLQGDLRRLPLPAGSFDLIWCSNTINHLDEPLSASEFLAALLSPNGRLVLAQSSLLPEMYFAWDARLERLTNEAVRRYYRDRYGIEERRLTAVRAIAGLLRSAGLRHVSAQTFIIERLSPLRPADREYFLEAVFRNTWGERLRPYLAPEDYAQLIRLCDPQDEQFALDRPDFHFLQTFTVAIGARP